MHLSTLPITVIGLEADNGIHITRHGSLEAGHDLVRLSAPYCVQVRGSVMKGAARLTVHVDDGLVIGRASSRTVRRKASSSCLRRCVRAQRVLHHLGRHAGAGRVAEGRQANRP
jgi:hypothetical protein